MTERAASPALPRAHARRRRAACAAWAAFAIAGCGDGAARRAEVTLPSLPLPRVAGLTIDEADLEARAARHCRAEGGAASAERFLLGDLPLGALDDLCAGAGDAASLAGHLYVSGLFGGVWLAAALDGEQSPVALEDGAGGLDGGAAIRDLVDGLARRSADAVSRAEQTGFEELAGELRDALPALVTLYGYNRGYLDITSENPPPGVPPPTSFTCDGLLDCDRAGQPFTLLAELAPALEALAEPPDEAWRDASAQVSRLGPPAVAAGRGVWEGILGGATFEPAAYQALIEVSGGYLLATEAAILANVSGWAGGDEAAARCAARLSSGLVTWSLSYFAGLSVAAPDVPFPGLVCEGG